MSRTKPPSPTWTHLRTLLPRRSDTNRRFLIDRILKDNWTTKDLRRQACRLPGHTGGSKPDGRLLQRPADLGEAVNRWTRLNEMRFRSNKVPSDPDRMIGLFEADPAGLDHDSSGIADQPVAMHTRIGNQLWVVSDLRKEARARQSTQGLASKPLKLARIDEDEVGPGDS
jgi:hypothetical protein